MFLKDLAVACMFIYIFRCFPIDAMTKTDEFLRPMNQAAYVDKQGHKGQHETLKLYMERSRPEEASIH